MNPNLPRRLLRDMPRTTLDLRRGGRVRPQFNLGRIDFQFQLDLRLAKRRDGDRFFDRRKRDPRVGQRVGDRDGTAPRFAAQVLNRHPALGQERLRNSQQAKRERHPLR